MKRLATMLIAACALALALVAISPDQASAGWRRWGGWGYYGPGVGVYVGPRYGYYGYGYRPYYYGGSQLSGFQKAIPGGGDGPLAWPAKPPASRERHMNGALSFGSAGSS